jgi:hypothetical protein
MMIGEHFDDGTIEKMRFPSSAYYCPLVRDQFWNSKGDEIEIPHTEASAGLMASAQTFSGEAVA